jgi:lysophospholipase L1-like esterase
MRSLRQLGWQGLRTPILGLFVAVVLPACGGAKSGASSGGALAAGGAIGGGAGAAVSAGGSTSSISSTSTTSSSGGGIVASNGGVSSGGANAVGGSATGGKGGAGAPGAGGSQPAGGAVLGGAGPGTGGAAAMGGTGSGTGGAAAMGGTGSSGIAATGGRLGTGGQGAGGTSATGGTPSAGGVSSTGGAGRSDGSAGGGVSATGGTTTAYNPCPPSGTECKIMPFGDSITDGYTVRGGYRIPFFQGAHQEGKQFTFVGSMTNGPATVDGVAFPQHHEGHSAHTMYDAPNAPIPRQGIAGYVKTSIPTYKPDIVLLMIGTNDVDGDVDLPNAPARLGTLIDSIIALDSHILVVAAQITPTQQDPLNQKIVTFNAGIPAEIKSRADAGKHVALVDMYSAFLKSATFKSTYLADRLHPNAAGYQVMSDVWNTVVHDLLR